MTALAYELIKKICMCNNIFVIIGAICMHNSVQFALSSVV